MITRDPSWSSMLPGMPLYEDIPEDQAEPIRDLFSQPGIVRQARFDVQNLDAYLFLPDHSRNYHFIKIYKADIKTSYAKIVALLGTLTSDKYTLSIPIMYGSKNGLNYAIFPYVSGRRCLPDIADLSRLGHSLACLHKDLKELAHTEHIIQTSTLRMQKLEHIASNGLSLALPDYMDVSFLEQYCSKYSLQLIDHRGAQIIHGDLNPGNLLMLDQSARTCFFDFEDTLHSYLPVIYDLAFVLERIVLLQSPDIASTLQLSRVFMDAYCEQGGQYQYQINDEYILCILSLRAFFLLINNYQCYGTKNQAEWEKFLFLAQAAEKNVELLKMILEVYE